MSTPETHPPTTEVRFCEACGARLGSGHFCPECGHEVHGHVAEPSAEAPTQVRPPSVPATAPAPPSAPRGRNGVLLAAIAAVVVIVAVGAGVVLLTGGDDGAKDETAFKAKVASVFSPVLGANRELSDELGRLRGTRPTGARLAVRTAQRATTMAQGALNALTVPEGAEGLASDARAALDRESTYLDAVSAVLNNPSSSSRDRVVDLASNLSSALSAAGPSVAGTEPTVSGADRLAAWAPQAARTLRDRAEAKEDRIEEQSGTTRATPSNPYANGRECGDGVYAGPNTSCEFAFNVRTAYFEAPGLVATVRAYSPATGRVYAMNCAPSGSAITCSGGNGASVTF